MHSKRWVPLGVVLFFTVLAVWAVASLRDDDSRLSVVARYVKQTMCWPADSSAVCVLKTMAKYEKKGRYDEAVSTGVALAEKYPDGPISGWIYEDISALYLRRAKMDSARREEYVKQAVSYRDKSVRSASDSPHSLQPLVALSVSIGDLSAAQRCIQYGNSMKLLDQMRLLANEDKDRLARQLRPDLAEHQKIDSLLNWIDVNNTRIGERLSASGCQEGHRSSG
jgi:hypothetical protein